MRYLIAILITIAVIIFVIIKLLSGGGGGNKAQPVVPAALSSYANTDTTVQYTIDNPVQNADTHRDIIISVGRDQVLLTITKGYDGEVVSNNTFTSSENAYATFLLSLEHSGDFTKGNTNSAVADERGYCATGDRYSYDIVDGSGDKIQHLWSTSCKVQTFAGNVDVVRALFVAQVPGFGQLTAGIDY